MFNYLCFVFSVLYEIFGTVFTTQCYAERGIAMASRLSVCYLEVLW